MVAIGLTEILFLGLGALLLVPGSGSLALLALAATLGLPAVATAAPPPAAEIAQVGQGLADIDTPEEAPVAAPGDIPAPADVAAAPKDATRTASGLAFKVLREGTGDKRPKAEDTVRVHYTGWTTDGRMFDSSVKRGEPASFPLNRVIKGWTEGLQTMVVGEKKRFWIPATLAYGETPSRPGAPAGTLVFDVELLAIQERPNLDAPPDVAAPPKDATRTASGLAWRSIKPGKGTRHPKATDRVRVHYTGWQTDGRMFDSSRLRGEPAVFPLNRVIAGWTEGVQLMVEGQTMRFWIPAALAYGETPQRPGAPAGMLVFDVELLGIE